ncbi:MAG TPA: DUF6188 family protein [Planctomycetota bacterium]|nr:DUF6188 family protein [Planctomycetota bacterium]
MYGLPDQFDTSFLIGLELESVVFHPFTMHLHFTNNITISITGAFSYTKNKLDKVETVKIPLTTKTDVMILVGKKIKEATGERNGTLTLTFDNEHIFVCYDYYPNYESYIIYRGKDETIAIV